MNISIINFPKKVINWIHKHTNEKQFLIFSSILVGFSAGFAAVILKQFVFLIRHFIVEGFFFQFNFKYLYLILPLVGIGLTGLLLKYFFQNRLDRGTTAILLVISNKKYISFRQMYSHIFTSGLTVGFGGSAGLESPIVSTGAAIGSNFARTYGLSTKDHDMLLAAGAAGGIAGAFNAPIAGVLFAIEVILIDINIRGFIPLLLASASGALLSQIVLHENLLLSFKLRHAFDYHNVFFYIIIGLLSGFLSLYHVIFFDFIESKFSKIQSRIKKWLLGGLLLASLYALFPSLFGEGYESIKSLSALSATDLFKNGLLFNFIQGKWSLLLLITFTLFFKTAAVGITLGSGGNGGNFAPSLFLGAYMGFLFAYFLTLIGFKNIPLGNFTIVAMAGILSGVFHAPLTAIFLIAEITGGYELIIPLMMVSSISYAIVKYFHQDSLDVRKFKKLNALTEHEAGVTRLPKI
jgi:CIC family chloride channel protein